jgi:hypothetical protein
VINKSRWEGCLECLRNYCRSRCPDPYILGRAVPLLLEGLKDPNAQVRQAALNTIKLHSDVDPLFGPKIAKLTRDPNDGVRGLALELAPRKSCVLKTLQLKLR